LNSMAELSYLTRDGLVEDLGITLISGLLI
jgi:hypothetical protein